MLKNIKRFSRKKVLSAVAPNIGCIIEYLGELFVFVLLVFFFLMLIQGPRLIKSKTAGLRPSS